MTVVALIAAAAVVAFAVHVGGLGVDVVDGWQVLSAPAGFSASDISCVSSRDCFVLGTNGPDSSSPRSAVWDLSGGSWVPLTVSPPGRGDLEGLTCLTVDDCWAVGDHFTVPPGVNDGVVQPFIEHDTGSGFSVASIPKASGDADALSAVTCVSEDECWAVGSYAANSENGGDGLLHPLIERYDGTAWYAIYASGPPLDGYLSGVTCVDADDCWAVGGVVDSNDDAELIEHYSGGVWTGVVGPDTEAPRGAGALSAVTCTSPDDCWAVGASNLPNTPTEETSQPLIERYTGEAWTTISSPFISAANGGGLTGIGCTAAQACWAVGLAQGPASDLIGTPPPDTTPTLLEQYTGARWNIVNGLPVGDTLTAISCIQSGGCYAIGGSLVEFHAGA